MVQTRDSHDGEAGPAVAAVINQLFLKKSGRYVLVIDAGSGNGSFLKWTHESFKRDGNYQRQRLYLVGYENNQTLVEQAKELLQDQPNTKVYQKDLVSFTNCLSDYGRCQIAVFCNNFEFCWNDSTTNRIHKSLCARLSLTLSSETIKVGTRVITLCPISVDGWEEKRFAINFPNGCGLSWAPNEENLMLYVYEKISCDDNDDDRFSSSKVRSKVEQFKYTFDSETGQLVASGKG